MLLTKMVKVRWNNKTKKHYENKGYKFTKQGDEFEVKVEDLTDGSNVYVDVKCDGKDCKEPFLSPIKWQSYKIHVHKNDSYYCQKCANMLFEKKQKELQTKLLNSKTFYDWCIEHNRQDILARWNYELNNCSPKDIGFSSNKKYWFNCSRGVHPSELKNVKSFTSGQEGSIECNMCKTLGFLHPEVFDIWSEKNEKTPYDYSVKSKEIAWFKCKDGKHDDYPRKISNSNNYDFRCPECVRERDESFLQEKVRLYLEQLGYGVLHEGNCNITPVNPKRNRQLPFDNEIEELKLIIEVNGIQHYQITSYTNQTAKVNGTTPEYELHYQQLKDRYKRFVTYKNEYEYLVISYFKDNKKEDWKKLINNKVNEILNKKLIKIKEYL